MSANPSPPSADAEASPESSAAPGPRPGVPSLDDSDSYRRVENLTAEELDALPFGIIQLDPQGTVLHYNTYESRLARLPKEAAIGRNFFREVAPCTDVREFQGRFLEGVRARQLDVKFRYHFPFRGRPRDVLITLFYSTATDSVFVLVQPIGDG
jgi:photoactive yellow protein